MSDVYIVIHLSTTCDENGVYVSKDSAEIIEIAWILLDANTLQEISSDSILIRPLNTPITALCTNLTTLTWEHVRNAGTFKDAILKLDSFIHDNITSKQLDFTFVTLNAWDLRVQLPREARDKNVVLPPYLQHSRCFDLKQEYAKWQTHHPETLSYSSSNLSSICTALEVELDEQTLTQVQQQAQQQQVQQQQAQVQVQQPQSGNSTPQPSLKSTLPFQLQQLAIQTPRRALNETNVLKKVLQSLIKKSTPIEDHSDVLTRPFDGRADVRAFLAERSKVLHLNNLPQDTTQSELESWFTQYGGRPIAFWTLKTPEQHKPTGLGFAVFSSHEEAAESLAMNGRGLNDKSIEVQPSSARVLDRAQEILTPFPPSKNRPRPGDWTCPSCGFSNFQRRTACFRCSFPAASAVAIQESMYSNNGSNQSSGSLSNGGGHNNNNNNNNHHHNNHNNHNNHQNHNNHHNNHNNHHNNYNNNNNHNNHNNNHTNHQNNGSQHYQNNSLNYLNNNVSNIGNGNGHNNNNNNNSNGNGNGNGNGNNRVSSVPFRAGDWKCGNEGCSYHNFAKNICCLRCGAPRVQSNINLDQQVSQIPQVSIPQQQVSQVAPQMSQIPQVSQLQQQVLNQGSNYQYEIPDITKQINGLVLNPSSTNSGLQTPINIGE
ncbi:putative RNA-binding protein [Wickerhamomyces ciferrii]|uniref:RNA-binding protein n=1 Tax=Wickerhamomyces ciferrii (strain ATCC 14091 / BCRC 22168 / CBS 111 / JCM 3599 / NBRC 0793 / NRRL Y-1031 F-60-10) TaxID=1206466 RepID=K0KGN0_WICCF|nr:putative RNA-binding protein [Wickerhamomyces ciferrii]CCH41337.1 putative RNA-binding protein [Wickerhamomyces ciferrii]